jgi:CubicO group peptidase (beta-lactamase class C family)
MILPKLYNMKPSNKYPFVLLFCLLISGLSFGQKTSYFLPRSTPVAEGMAPEAIASFLEAANKSKHEFHSIMVLRHGKVIAEAWWAPYSADLRHTMYSCSKSFTATAVGFAVSEGKIALDDKVISFFPEYAPKEVSPYLAELTIHHLLTMTDGMDPDPSFTLAVTDDNWIKGFFNTPIVKAPGTVFLYNSLGTYMGGAIVQKVTGQSLVEYLKPRLFEPLGIEGMDWESDLLGYNVGGWGLRIKTEDMAKFAQLFLQKGMWNGKQVLPAGWVEEASSKKILQQPELSDDARSKNDWAQGYCYQMWRSRHNSYRGDGAYGQLIMILPEQDAVIAVTAETDDMQGEMNLIWDYLLPGFQDAALPASQTDDAPLRQQINALQLPKMRGKATSPVAKSIQGKSYKLQPNDLQLESLKFDFDKNEVELNMAGSEGQFSFEFGADHWEKGTTKRLGPYLARVKGYYQGLPPAKVVGNYGWLDENTLQLKLRYIESPHSETLTCHFDGKKLKVEYEKSNDFGNKKLELEGVRK